MLSRFPLQSKPHFIIIIPNADLKYNVYKTYGSADDCAHIWINTEMQSAQGTHTHTNRWYTYAFRVFRDVFITFYQFRFGGDGSGSFSSRCRGVERIDMYIAWLIIVVGVANWVVSGVFLKHARIITMLTQRGAY